MPSTDPGLFDLFVDAHEVLGVGDGGTLGPITLEAGNHNVHENEHTTGSLANYVTSVSCVESNADGVINPASPLTGNGGFEIITVLVAAGDQWTCTETNTHKGTIEVVKHLIPSSDPGTFDLSVDGTTVPNLGDGGTTGPITVEAGNHNVHENEHATGSLANYVTSVSCVESNADGHVSSSSPLTGPGGFQIITVPVAAGDQWLCTETNTRATATLTVVKHVVNDTRRRRDRGSVDHGRDRRQPEPGDVRGVRDGTAVTILANAGYAVAESGGPAGYTAASSAACANASGLAPGATATCTITNDDRPVTLTLIKHVVNDSSSGSATAASFTLTVTGTAVPGPNASNSRGLPGAELPGTVIPLRPGTYTVTETGPTGYAATSAGSCTNVVVALGDTPTCTITNDDVARPIAFRAPATATSRCT